MSRTSDAKDRILNATFALMWERSFSDVGVAEICAKAEVQKGSFYHYFVSKRDLALEVIERTWIQLRDNNLKVNFHKDIPPLERLKRFFETEYKFHADCHDAAGHVNGCPLGNIALEMSTQDESIRTRLDEIFTIWAGFLQEAIDDAVRAGSNSQVETNNAGLAMIAYIQGATLMSKIKNDPVVFKMLADDYIQKFPDLSLLTAGLK